MQARVLVWLVWGWTAGASPLAQANHQLTQATQQDHSQVQSRPGPLAGTVASRTTHMYSRVQRYYLRYKCLSCYK